MATPLIMARWPQLIKTVPAIEKIGGTLLYVGANRNRHHYMPELHDMGYEVTVLEVWEPNLKEIAQKEMVHRAVLGNACKVDEYDLGENMFDVSFWWHGPEHVDAAGFAQALFRLERITRKLIILGSPWGNYTQGAVKGNPFEEHVRPVLPEHYEAFGYKTVTLGTKDVIDSNSLAWKPLSAQSRRRSANMDKWIASL